MTELPGRDWYLATWRESHLGYVPADPFSRGWFGLVYAVAAPLARRRVPPAAVTAGGVAVMVGLPVGCALAAGSERWWWILVSLAALGASALADGVDGCVALLEGMASPAGARADWAADRVGEALMMLGLVLLGAHPLLLLGLLPCWGAEAWRWHGHRRGRTMGVITVFERPFRLLLLAAALLGCAGTLAAGAASVGGVATVGAALWSVLALISLAQLARSDRR